MTDGPRLVARRLVFAVPGRLDQRTGGYLFDRRIVDGLRADGRDVRVAELAGRHPDSDDAAQEAAARAVADARDADALVIDGLALPAFAHCLAGSTRGPARIGFIHHPLSLETGLPASDVARFEALERRLWSALDGVVCASAHTARAVCAAGVPSDRVAVAAPGVALPPLESIGMDGRAHASPTVRLLCVATVTPRKGHLLLVEALARMHSTRPLDWHLDCIGSLHRDPGTVAALREAIAACGLADRVTLHGELPDAQLDAAWRDADLFVLASHHEGYGMVLTEALAHGLPVVATRAGAIPETMPADACLLVPPGDVAALAGALQAVIASPARRATLAAAARDARAGLVPWPTAVRRWAEVVDALCRRRGP